jgi:hypothetical protein
MWQEAEMRYLPMQKCRGSYSFRGNIWSKLGLCEISNLMWNEFDKIFDGDEPCRVLNKKSCISDISSVSFIREWVPLEFCEYLSDTGLESEYLYNTGLES